MPCQCFILPWEIETNGWLSLLESEGSHSSWISSAFDLELSDIVSNCCSFKSLSEKALNWLKERLQSLITEANYYKHIFMGNKNKVKYCHYLSTCAYHHGKPVPKEGLKEVVRILIAWEQSGVHQKTAQYHFCGQLYWSFFITVCFIAFGCVEFPYHQSAFSPKQRGWLLITIFWKNIKLMLISHISDWGISIITQSTWT